MTTIADQLAGALREAMEWDWITDAENIAPIVVAQCDAALSAYEASRTAPAVREAPREFVEWFCCQVPPGTIISDPIWWAWRVWKAAHSDRLNGEAG